MCVRVLMLMRVCARSFARIRARGTGDPKGVVLTHLGFCSGLASAAIMGLKMGPSDVHLS